MKFLHLMKNEKFTKGISDFYSCFFANGEHEILYVNTPGKETLIDPNRKIRQEEIYLGERDYGQLRKIYQMASRYDYVVMHSMFLAHPLILMYPKLIKKLIWIAWGYDLHNWPPKDGGIRNKLDVAVGNYVRNRCAGFVGIFLPDCEYFKKRFPKARAEVFYAPYVQGKIPEEYKCYKEQSNLDCRKIGEEPLYIQVGHSAVKAVKHLDVLEKLAHLKDENIRVFIPLSYGDVEYAQTVEQRALEIFGDKVICLRDFMPKDAYFALLSRVDVAVFNTERQIALGNINLMLFRNVKLYMPENSIMYRYFVSEGIPVQKYESIASADVFEIAKPVRSEEPEKFRRYISNMQSNDEAVALWQQVYAGYISFR